MVSEASTSQSRTSLQLEATTGILTHNFYHPSSTGGERAERSKLVERGSLLPILPDDFTINLILPKLPWRVLVKLTQLNRAWRAGVRSPEVYDVRARASTSQTIVTIQQNDCIVSLYDTATETWHALPRPPFGHRRVARGCCCVSMCGKLYILGGSGLRNNMHVFEFAGQGCWKECASMKSARKNFACVVHGGKIYVFGGTWSPRSGNAAEVYDPKQDLWCDIAPMLTQRMKHKVVTIGDIFCIYLGGYFKSSNDHKRRWIYADFAEIYDPRKDRWTATANFTIDGSPKSMEPRPRAKVATDSFVIDGKLHRILDDWLYVYEPSSVGIDSKALNWDETGSWKAVQSVAWGVFRFSSYVNPCARDALIVPSGGELLALVFGPTDSANNNRRWTFLKSEGLGCADRKLSWKRVEGSFRSTRSLLALTLGTHKESHVEFSPCIASIAGPW